jgi:hypothetical protein
MVPDESSQLLLRLSSLATRPLPFYGTSCGVHIAPPSMLRRIFDPTGFVD